MRAVQYYAWLPFEIGIFVCVIRGRFDGFLCEGHKGERESNRRRTDVFREEKEVAAFEP